MAQNIVGLMGKAGSGKDSFANRLVTRHGYRRLAFADTVKSMAVALDPIIEIDQKKGGHQARLTEVIQTLGGWDGAKQLASVRGYLQELGCAARDTLGKDVWLRAVADRAAFIPGPVVVTDVRFHNEADWVQLTGGALVRIERPSLDTRDAHVSENELNARIANHVVTNDGTLEDLHRTADFIAEFLTGVSSASLAAAV